MMVGVFLLLLFFSFNVIKITLPAERVLWGEGRLLSLQEREF